MAAGSVSCEKVDMRYSIFFRQDAGGDRLAHIELTYDLSYRMGDQQTRKLHTVAILRPYDLGEPFFEPIFDTPYDRSDHCQITFLPYDSVFWSLNQGLVRTDRQEAALRFFADHGALVGHKDRSFTDVDDLLFDGLYTVWSSTSRITRSTIVRSEPPSPIQGNTLAENATQARSTKVDIEATIYLDAYEGPGGYSVRSATILDVFGSRYDLPMESGTNAFLNIWFDLCEIERRRMERDLGYGTLTEEKVRTAHAETMERIERTTLRFEKETSMGKNVEAMQSWNELVLRELGLNNLALFPMLD